MCDVRACTCCDRGHRTHCPGHKNATAARLNTHTRLARQEPAAPCSQHRSYSPALLPEPSYPQPARSTAEPRRRPHTHTHDRRPRGQADARGQPAAPHDTPPGWCGHDAGTGWLSSACLGSLLGLQGGDQVRVALVRDGQNRAAEELAACGAQVVVGCGSNNKEKHVCQRGRGECASGGAVARLGGRGQADAQPV